MRIRLRHIVKRLPASPVQAMEPSAGNERRPRSEQRRNKNKDTKEKDEMITKEDIERMENIADELKPEIKRVMKDKGLIERTESSKIVLTEDNRQVLND